MHTPMLRSQTLLDGEESVAEVRFRCQACADAGSRLGDEIELAIVRVRGMNDGGSRSEAPCAGEELDRANAVLLEALLDLARLLVGVDVEGQGVLSGIAADLLEPFGGARAHGVGGEPDAMPRVAEAIDLLEIFIDGVLAEALDPAARVGGMEEHEGDSCCLGSLRGRECLVETEVMELAYRGVAGGPHLAVDLLVLAADPLGALLVGEGEHRVAPGPEVAALGAAAEGALESVAVCVDEAGNREPLRHGATLSARRPPIDRTADLLPDSIVTRKSRTRRVDESRANREQTIHAALSLTACPLPRSQLRSRRSRMR